MGDAFECDRCESLKRGTGNRRTKYGTDSEGHRTRDNRDYCDRCDEIIEKVASGELTIDDFRLHGGGKRP